MTDLEMTRLCAEAMDYYPDVVLSQIGAVPLLCYLDGASDSKGFDYDPLHDDAQAMKLVKECKLGILYSDDDEWMVFEMNQIGENRYMTISSPLNRAIVECVAKMQAKRTK